MPTSECLGRIASGVGRVDYGRMRTAQFEDDDWAGLIAAVGRLNHAPLWFDDAGGLSIADVRTRSRRLKRAHPCLGLIVVDHIGLLRGEGRTENRTQEVGTISRGLKRLAKELALPVIALCQLNRGLESRADKRPVMSDLRESGDIEQDADTVIAVYRDEVYYPDSADAGCVELILRKCRGGPLTTVAALNRIGAVAVLLRPDGAVTREARLGLNGPQVIEQEAGIAEYDSRDRPFIWSLTGGEQRFASGFADAYLADDLDEVRTSVLAYFAKGLPARPRCRRAEDYLRRLGDLDTAEQPDAAGVRRLYQGLGQGDAT